jgi:hypothetical protein
VLSKINWAMANHHITIRTIQPQKSQHQFVYYCIIFRFKLLAKAVLGFFRSALLSTLDLQRGIKLEVLISTLFAGGIGVAVGTAISVLLSKKLLAQFLKRDMEKYKVSLNIEKQLLIEGKSHALKEEIKKINILWELVYTVITECKKINGEESKACLSMQLEKLDLFLAKEKPFISKKIFELTFEITKLSDPDTFSKKSIDKLRDLENKLVYEIRKILYIK